MQNSAQSVEFGIIGGQYGVLWCSVLIVYYGIVPYSIAEYSIESTAFRLQFLELRALLTALRRT